MEILFVSLNSNCISSIMLDLFTQRLKIENLQDAITCDCAFLTAATEKPGMDCLSKLCQESKIDPCSHQSHLITQEDFKKTDLFVCTDSACKEILIQSNISADKIYILNPDIAKSNGIAPEKLEEFCGKIKNALNKLLAALYTKPILAPLSELYVSSVAEIEKACFSHPWSEKSIREELYNDNARFYVALLNKTAVGYAGMHCICGECYVDNIAVLPQFRRKGIGRLLVKQLIRQAAQEQGQFISLEVRVSNLPARALYEQFGFSERGRRKNFYQAPTEDGLIYTLDLE